jgi:hypothetical protein
VPRAFDRLAVELALPKDSTVVGAYVLDRAPFVILGATHAQRSAVELHDADRARNEV